MYIRKHPAPSIRRLLRGAVFTTFCHQKVVPKVSAGHLPRDRTKAVTERSHKICAVCARSLRAFHPLSDLFPSPVQCGERQEWVCKPTFSRRTQRPLADFAEPPQSKRRKGLRRKSGVFCARSVSAGVGTRCFSPCLIFWCFWIKTKAHKKEYAPQKKSILRKEFRRQDRLRRICGPKAAGHAHGGGPPQAETSTRTAQRPAIFQAGLWGFARPKPGLHGTLLREFPKSSFKQEISARPAPFRPARPSRHPEGQQTYRKEHTPPDKQREPFPMKRFPFSFPRRIPPDPA